MSDNMLMVVTMLGNKGLQHMRLKIALHVFLAAATAAAYAKFLNEGSPGGRCSDTHVLSLGARTE